MANRACAAKLRLIDVRDADGRLVRKVDEAQAARLVETDAGRRVNAREVRLNIKLGSDRTWFGSAQVGRVRVASFAHNTRVCNFWKQPTK
jgi:hypothetical protein